MNPNSGLPYPVPSVAINEKTFNRRSDVARPNMDQYQLASNPRLGTARRIGDSESAERTKRSRWSSPKEFRSCGSGMNPISGKALGNMEYGWSTLVIDLMMDPIR